MQQSQKGLYGAWRVPRTQTKALFGKKRNNAARAQRTPFAPVKRSPFNMLCCSVLTDWRKGSNAAAWGWSWLVIGDVM
jgi:hypothetical protein